MQNSIGPFNLTSTFLRLRPNASIEPLPVNDTFWQKITTGQLGRFHNEYLVTTHTFDADWPIWEIHPNGDEIVCLLSGTVVLVLESVEGTKSIELSNSGDYALVPENTWHTAKANGPCRMLFITAGEGTQHRGVAE